MKLPTLSDIGRGLTVMLVLGGGVSAQDLQTHKAGTPQSCMDAVRLTTVREGLITQNQESCSIKPSTFESRELCIQTGNDIEEQVPTILKTTKACFKALQEATGADVKEVALQNKITEKQLDEIMDAE